MPPKMVSVHREHLDRTVTVRHTDMSARGPTFSPTVLSGVLHTPSCRPPPLRPGPSGVQLPHASPEEPGLVVGGSRPPAAGDRLSPRPNLRQVAPSPLPCEVPSCPQLASSVLARILLSQFRNPPPPTLDTRAPWAAFSKSPHPRYFFIHGAPTLPPGSKAPLSLFYSGCSQIPVPDCDTDTFLSCPEQSLPYHPNKRQTTFSSTSVSKHSVASTTWLAMSGMWGTQGPGEAGPAWPPGRAGRWAGHSGNQLGFHSAF